MRDGDVVVIGGGYAGVRLAKRLDGTARVTLVDRKEVFFHRIASLRAGVRPEWSVTPFIPYDRLLRGGRVVMGKAVRVDTDERQVVLATGERLPYDVVVIATGADYPEPARFTGSSAEEAVKSFAGHQRAVATAEHVLVGGGPSGVELSAEIRLARPDARVTLAHSGAALLHSTGSERAGRKALAWLEAHDVQVRLDSFMSPGNDFGTYRDAHGNVIDADLSFWATGTTPNTLWLRLAGHGEWLNAAGHVKVDRMLRVDGRLDVFAVGDVNDATELKITPAALAQADLAAHNIRTYLPAEFREAPQGAPLLPADPTHPAHRALRLGRRTDRAAHAARRERGPREPHLRTGQGEDPHDSVHEAPTRVHRHLYAGRPVRSAPHASSAHRRRPGAATNTRRKGGRGDSDARPKASPMTLRRDGRARDGGATRCHAREGEDRMGTVLLAMSAVAAIGFVAIKLVRAGQRAARAEKARLAEDARRQARRSLDTVWAMDDREFEEFVADLCRRDGCTDVKRVGGAGDLGADVTGLLPDGSRFVIQCKRYAKHRTVGSRDIQTFNGTARAEHGADVPLFVASCVFTRPARDFAARHDLCLIDVNLLGFWNSGTALTSFLDLDIGRSGNNRRLRGNS